MFSICRVISVSPGDTRNWRDTLYVSRPRNIQPPTSTLLSSSFCLLCTIWLTYTKGETKLRIKSPDACNAFFIKVSELYGLKCVTHIIYTYNATRVYPPRVPLYPCHFNFPRFHGISWIFTAFFAIVYACTRIISFPFLSSVAGKLQSLRVISQIFRIAVQLGLIFSDYK